MVCVPTLQAERAERQNAETALPPPAPRAWRRQDNASRVLAEAGDDTSELAARVLLARQLLPSVAISPKQVRESSHGPVRAPKPQPHRR